MNTPSPIENLNITDVRRELVQRSNELHERGKAYSAALADLDPAQAPADADLDAYEGLETASTYAWTLAAVLRLVAERHPDAVFDAAAIVETAMNAGTDWLDDANEDLNGGAAL
jgi:hypothetical protein